MQDFIDIAEYSLVDYTTKVVAATKAGFELDTEAVANSPTFNGVAFFTRMFKPEQQAAQQEEQTQKAQRGRKPAVS